MKKIFIQINSTIGIILGYVYFVHAQAPATPTTPTSTLTNGTFRDLVASFGNFISGKLMPVVISIAILVFFWNLIQYLANLGNEKDREQFKKYSINAILAFFILLSFWGIIGIFTSAFFGLKPLIPQLPTSGN